MNARKKVLIVISSLLFIAAMGLKGKKQARNTHCQELQLQYGCEWNSEQPECKPFRDQGCSCKMMSKTFYDDQGQEIIGDYVQCHTLKEKKK